MKKTIFLLAASLLFVSCSGIRAGKADKRLDEIRQELNAVGFSVAVIRDNRVEYTGAFGMKDLESGQNLHPRSEERRVGKECRSR